MEIKERLKLLSDELNLSYEVQDWGIINSSADRLGEFLLFYQNYANFSEQLKYQFLELIIASYNEGIIEGKITESIKQVFENLINESLTNELFHPIFKYWMDIRNDDFPVGDLINKLNRVI